MRPRRYRLPLARLLLASVVALGCGQQAPPGDATPLVDGLHAPQVLTESALLERAPSFSGNRFLSGWWPSRFGGSPSQANVGDRVVLEAVFLDGRERRLATRLAILEGEPGATFGVRIAGVDLPPQLLTADAEVPLPGGLPLGRLPIELDLRGARVEIQAAGFGHAWPPGEVTLTAESIVQGGYSAIDFPRRLPAITTLVGQFEPPAEAEPEQRFAVLVSTDESAPEIAFEWRTGESDGPKPLRHTLPSGFVRIRLLAQGLGPTGRWLGLGIAGPDPSAPGRPAPGRPATELPKLTTIPGRVGNAYVAASDRYRLIRAPGLGLPTDTATSRDAEYVFDLRRDPAESRNLVGAQAIEIDWLRARLESWMQDDSNP